MTFNNGQYYSIGVKMNCGNVDLSAATGDVVLNNGDVAYGTLAGIYRVSIRSGATVILNGVYINGSDDEAYNWAGIECAGSATINLAGTNTVRPYGIGYPGIWIPGNKTLTIQGDGELEVSGSNNGAGIGSGYNTSCGNITVKGDTITATGSLGAGIGTGDNGKCGNITIASSVTRVTANSDRGQYSVGKIDDSGTCGKVTIVGITYFNGSSFVYDGDSYLSEKPFVYEP